LEWGGGFIPFMKGAKSSLSMLFFLAFGFLIPTYWFSKFFYMVFWIFTVLSVSTSMASLLLFVPNICTRWHFRFSISLSFFFFFFLAPRSLCYMLEFAGKKNVKEVDMFIRLESDRPEPRKANYPLLQFGLAI